MKFQNLEKNFSTEKGSGFKNSNPPVFMQQSHRDACIEILRLVNYTRERVSQNKLATECVSLNLK